MPISIPRLNRVHTAGRADPDEKDTRLALPTCPTIAETRANGPPWFQNQRLSEPWRENVGFS